jgi:hypothetical protein
MISPAATAAGKPANPSVDIWQQRRVQHVSIKHDLLVPLVHDLLQQQLVLPAGLVSLRAQQ